MRSGLWLGAALLAFSTALSARPGLSRVPRAAVPSAAAGPVGRAVEGNASPHVAARLSHGAGSLPREHMGATRRPPQEAEAPGPVSGLLRRPRRTSPDPARKGTSVAGSTPGDGTRLLHSVPFAGRGGLQAARSLWELQTPAAPAAPPGAVQCQVPHGTLRDGMTLVTGNQLCPSGRLPLSPHVTAGS